MVNKDKTHFVLVAGFSSDNQEVIGLKKMLEDKGYSASALNFYGSKKITDFTDLTEQECVDNLAQTIEKLAEKYETLYGIGISLGGALLLENAKRGNQLKGIVSIGTPFKLKRRQLISLGQKFFPFIYFFWKRMQKWKKLRLNPIGAAKMVINYIEGNFQKELEKIKIPVLFLHSRKDKVTDYRAVRDYLAVISSEKKDSLLFDNGNHVINYNPVIVEWTFDFFELEN
jgi:esterase/lipase